MKRQRKPWISALLISSLCLSMIRVPSNFWNGIGIIRAEAAVNERIATSSDAQEEELWTEDEATPSDADPSDELDNDLDLEDEVLIDFATPSNTAMQVQLEEEEQVPVYYVNFVQNLTKEFGKPDPTYVSYWDAEITTSDGDKVYSRSEVILEREPGEAGGIYRITGMTDPKDEVRYVVEDSEFAYLEIQKNYLRDTFAGFYFDANVKKEGTIDVIGYKDRNGKPVVPEDILNPVVTVGTLDEAVMENLSELPQIEGTSVVIKIADQVSRHVLEIPVIVSSDNYKDFTFKAYLTVDYIEERTQEEIKAYYKSHPFDLYMATTFADTPKMSPYHAGKISEKSMQDGLNALNFVRYIAGLGDVELSDELSYYCQAGSVIMARNNVLSHHPEQPSDMPDDFYNDGCIGTSNANIALGYKNLSDSLINGYMEDGDSKNIMAVGHRRWCLNPAMGQIGWGACQRYSALYAHDDSAAETATAGYVAWPARQMPYEYFKGPWSIQFSRDSYEYLNENVEVTLTTSSGKTYSFSDSSSDGFFNIDTGGYGNSTAVIFKPDAALGKNEKVTVHVTGLKRPDGTSTEVQYDVQFFSMSTSTGGSGGSSGGSGGSSGGSGGSSGGSGGSSGGSGGSSGGPGVGTAVGRLGAAAIGAGPSNGILTTGTYAYGNAWEFNGSKWRLRTFQNLYAASQWALVDSKWYVFDSQGYMMTGWQYVDGSWYFMNADGSMATGWIFVDNKWYCLASNGVMYASTHTPDGYYVNASGVWMQ